MEYPIESHFHEWKSPRFPFLENYLTNKIQVWMMIRSISQINLDKSILLIVFIIVVSRNSVHDYVKITYRTTDSTKINRPGHNIRMHWAIFRQPTVHVQQHIFEKILIEICSSYLYASFGTFYVQIGQFFEAQWIFKHSEEFRNRRHFPSKTAICRFSNIFQRLTVPQMIYQFGRKRCQKKHKDVDYKLLSEFFQKYPVAHE